MEKIKIVGTSHIAKESLKQITQAFNEFVPDIVAVELDRKRLGGLLSRGRAARKRDLLRLGLFGAIFAMVGSYAQKKLGGSVGVVPGSDMLQAVKLAKGKGLKIALIDRDIEVTLKRLSASIKFRDVISFLVEAIKSVFCPKKAGAKLLEGFDLNKVPEDQVVEKMVAELEKRYPKLYRVLVGERNMYMLRQLKMLEQKYPEEKILVVIGAGHKKFIEQNL